MFETILSTAWNWLSAHFNFLVLFGLIGQTLFMMRFLAQWLHSEKMGRSAVPEVFWIFSMLGGLVLLIYAILKNDLVFIIGQALGLFIYARNLFFIYKNRTILQQSNPHDILAQLSQHTAQLVAKGDAISANEAKAAAEALAHLKQK